MNYPVLPPHVVESVTEIHSQIAKHGDLHAENICLLPDGEVVIYDCLEFAGALRCADVAAEIAFLAMDLERRGAPALAAAFVDRYVERTGDREARLLRRRCGR